MVKATPAGMEPRTKATIAAAAWSTAMIPKIGNQNRYTERLS
jgi:hypothetical protein